MKKTKSLFSFYLMMGLLIMSLGLSAQKSVKKAPQLMKKIPILGYSIYGIKLSPPSPAKVNHNQKVNISFKFTSKTKNIYIWARPMTGNSTSPNYAASGSQLYTTTSGKGSQYFTITKGKVMVDKIRFQIYDKSKKKLLYQKFIAVKYFFTICLPMAKIKDCVITGASGGTAGMAQMSFSWSFDPPPWIKPNKLLLTVFRKHAGSWVNIMPSSQAYTVNPPSSTSATVLIFKLFSGEYKVEFEAFYTCNRVKTYTFYLNF
jgi:hypothetical protein